MRKMYKLVVTLVLFLAFSAFAEEVPAAQPEPAAPSEPVAEPGAVTQPEPVANPEPVAQPKTVAQPEPTAATEPVASPEPVAQPEPAAKPEVAAKPAAKTSDRPVFKVQVLASGSRLKATDAQLKGQKDVDCYLDGGMYKYTVGASEDYNAIYQLRKSLVSRFPQAFIIAFKNGKRMDVQEAIQEFKKKVKR